MLLALDIGNTNIHVGTFEKNKLTHSFCLGTDDQRSGDEYAFTLKSLIESDSIKISEIDGVVIGSVAPHVTSKLEYAVYKITGIRPLLVGPGTKTGFHIKLDDPSQLGADLAANVAATIEECGAPAIIVDFGTAITISCIDREKSLVGCYIMPGIQMSLNALNSTGLLPSVMADRAFPVVGKNSVDSMRAGVVFGSVLAAEGFIDTFKREFDLPKTTQVVVTGGFADMFMTYFNIKAKHIPSLTLKGLNAIYNTNPKKHTFKL